MMSIGDMKTAVLESPFAGDVERNLAYARACMGWMIHHGYAPFASHLLYTQEGVLDDDVPEERTLGIEAGLMLGRQMEVSMLFVDLGVSSGMKRALEYNGEVGRVPVIVKLSEVDPEAWAGLVERFGAERMAA
jgi:hypothetical protein